MGRRRARRRRAVAARCRGPDEPRAPPGPAQPPRGHRRPFAAVVTDAATGAVLSVGVNLVLASGLSGMHAEVVALCLAQAGAATWDLGAAGRPPVELAVNWRPCAMCYGAVLWSGVARLVIAGEGDEVEHLTGFDEGPMRPDWKEQLAARGVEVRTDVLRAEALATFREYGERPDVIVYNGGGRGRSTPAAPQVR
ncbi:tRNA-specific adenosine deaminase [Dactylosporangium darangshiense]|uniref:hypothetical protein n=1 Tax=Dactylosporangium darangshiense TaxID=579108 RepID=UPI003630360D